METQARFLAVGSFVLLLGIGILGFVMWLGKKELTSHSNIYDIYFQNTVTGLKIGASVLYRGVPVGSVRSISIDPEHIERIRVRVALTETAPLRIDTKASLEMQGITGISFVQLTGGNPGSPPLKPSSRPPYPVIPSKPSKIEEIFESTPKLLQNLSIVVSRLDVLLNEKNVQNFSDILDNLRVITQTISQKSKTIDEILEHSNKTVKNISATVLSFQDLTNSLRTEFIPLSKSAQEFFNQSREFLSVNQTPLNSFLTSGLYEFSNALSELRRSLESINRISNRIERDPWTFLFGTGEQGYVLSE